MSATLPFEQYVKKLGRLTPHVDPAEHTAEAEVIRQAARELAALGDVSVGTLASWVSSNPAKVPVLGLVVGLGQEKLKNVLRYAFDTSGWTTLARHRPAELVAWLDVEFELIHALTVAHNREYEFGDVLIARAGSRVTAARASLSGRRVEDEIEAVAAELGLRYDIRTRFAGRQGRTAPCDLVVPSAIDAQIIVAAKGFDSTGSKLTDAVREIEEMAEIRLPRQFVIAVIDGIGWKSRQADLRRIHALWENQQIDGMYTLATLSQFRVDLREAAKLRHLLL